MGKTNPNIKQNREINILISKIWIVRDMESVRKTNFHVIKEEDLGNIIDFYAFFSVSFLVCFYNQQLHHMLETRRKQLNTEDLAKNPQLITHKLKNVLQEKSIDKNENLNRQSKEKLNFVKKIKRTTCCIFKKINAEEISSDKFLTERPNFFIYVKMHRHIPHGKALYLVGNCKQLGNWDVDDGLKLQWSQDDHWRGSVLITSPEDIEYKYVIADYDNATNPEWEQGCNRLISVGEVQEGEVFLNEKWNHELITLEVMTQDAEQVYVIGNTTQLGLWTSKRYMRSYKQQEKNKMLWSLTFHMQKNKEYLHYYYIKKQAGIYVKQQQPGRYLHVVSEIMEQRNFVNRLTLIRKPGEIKVLDCDNFKEFKFSEITDELYVGPYLKKEQEVIQLTKKKIKGVLSLQSKQDMVRCGVQWPQMVELYKIHGIKAVNIEMIDRKSIDFVNKSGVAVRMLSVMVEKYKKVYVHCTAGIFRSPQLIVLFLARFRGFGLHDAVSLIKRRRPYARPEHQCLQESLQRLDQDKQNVNTTNG